MPHLLSQACVQGRDSRRNKIKLVAVHHVKCQRANIKYTANWTGKQKAVPAAIDVFLTFNI
jgi:hypothetical protein